MLGNGYKTKVNSRPTRGHCTTTTSPTHGMDYTTKNRVYMYQNMPQNPLIWQPKWLNHKACITTFSKAQKNNLSRQESDDEWKHTSMDKWLKWHMKWLQIIEITQLKHASDSHTQGSQAKIQMDYTKHCKYDQNSTQQTLSMVRQC